MRIGWILTTFPCLTETFAVREMRSLRETGFDITVFAAASGQAGRIPGERPTVFYRPRRLSREAAAAIGWMLLKYPIGCCKLLFLISRLLWLCPREALSVAGNVHTVAFFARQVNRERVDHIHSYFLSWPAAIGMAVSTVIGRPFSISAHARDIFVERGAVGLKALRAKFIRTCTQHGLHHLKATLPAECHDKLHVACHGVKTVSRGAGADETKGSVSRSDKTIIAVGRLVEKKGFADLLRALALLSAEKADCRLMIIGDGPQEKNLKELAGQLGLQSAVEFAGAQEADVTGRLLGQAALLAAPSRIARDGDMDGIPNVILEAFAVGVPVAAGNAGGISEAVKHRHTGLLVEPGDVPGLVSAIKELLDDPQLRARLARNAFEVVTRRFDADGNAKQLSELFLASASTRHSTMKVVHILEGFVGGTRTYVCNVLPQLVENGFDVTLVCSLNRSPADSAARISQLKAGGVKVHIIPMSREISLLKDIQSFINILRLLLKIKPDIVHTHCSKAGALGRVAAFLAGRPAIVHSPHCFAFLRCRDRSKKLLYLFFERVLGKLTTRLAAVSPSEASVAVDYHIVSGDKCTRISNGLSNSQPSQQSNPAAETLDEKTRLGVAKDAKVVTTACRLVDYKGVFRYLQAAKVSRTANTVFLLAGEGELKEAAEEFISENRLSERVRLLGDVSNMERLYAVSDLVVLCSDAEAQPYLLLEAMRARCPVVATSVIGNTDLISHDRTGLLVEPSPAAIAAAIDALLTDKQKRAEYAQNAYDYFREHHSLEKQVSELRRAYIDCMRDGDSDGPENAG